MFELEVAFCNDKSYTNKENGNRINRFAVWVKLPNSSSCAWIRTSKPYAPGSKIKLTLVANPYNDFADQLMLQVVE